MNTSRKQGHVWRAGNRPAIEINLTATGCALLMLAVTGSARSQTPDAAEETSDELETVEITGIRRGIEDAIELKRESTSIVEAISAEDIGKLPDTSIAPLPHS